MAEINRRDFVRTSLVGGLAVGAAVEPLLGQAPAVVRTVRPVVISSNNGNRFKNGGTAVARGVGLRTGVP